MNQTLFSVADYMNGVLLHAEKNESVLRIAQLMHRTNADAILIRDQGVPVGIVTYKELLSGLLSAMDSDSLILGEHIMNSPVFSIAHNEDISLAWRIMSERRIEQLPVRKENDIIGLIVQHDLIRDLSWYEFRKR